MEARTIFRKNSFQDPFEQSVLNKKVTLPPKEIITKQYSPDVKPMMKLITKQQLQKTQKNISYVPPKVKNQQFQKYGLKFHITDFLGYHYSEQLDQMIYFRFNNEQYNQINQNNSQKSVKYFSGMFIPLRALQSKHFKAANNIYEALNINLPQIKDSITQSFAKNCKGCSLDPIFSSNYVSANLMAVIRKKPFQYDLILQNDINSKVAEWFNFAVKFIQEGTYTFNIVNLSTQNSLYQNGMKIPFYSFLQQSFKNQAGLQNSIKSGNGWSYGCRNVKLNKSQIRKQNQLFDQTYNCLSFQFKCKNRQEVVVFASSIPYTGLDYQRFLNRVLYSKIGQHMKMQKIEIGKSLAGSPLSAYLFYHRKTKSNTVILKSINSQQKLNSIQSYRSNQRHRTLIPSYQGSSSNILNVSLPNNAQINTSGNPVRTVVFMARQHSGQTGSSFILEGIVQFLMDNTQFDVFKKNFQFIVIPFVNLDGVIYGNQKTNLAGSDLAKVWKNPNQIFEPEVYSVKKFLKNVNQMHPIALFVNLQNNNHTLSSYFSTTASNPKKTTLLPYQPQEPTQLYPFICSKRIPQVSFSKCQFYSNNTLETNSKKSSPMITTLCEVFPKALVYSFSCSSYGWKNESIGFRRYTQTGTQDQESEQSLVINEFTPDSFRNLGRQLISTYLQYVRLCDKNIGIKDRWLKEIQSLLPSINEFKNKDIIQKENNCEKKYEQTWDRQLMRFDYSLYLPSSSQVINQRSQNRKQKTSIIQRLSGTSPNQNRSKSKKFNMPQIRNGRYSKQEKQNQIKSSLNTDQIVQAESNGENFKNISQNISLNRQKNNISMQSLINQFKKTPLSSSIFTSKRPSQILKQISECIEPAAQKQSSFIIGNQKGNLQPSNLQTILQKKQKRFSKMLLNPKNLQILKNQNKDQSANSSGKTKLKDAIVKFENMKKFMSTMGIKSIQNVRSQNFKDFNLIGNKQKVNS